MDEFLKLKFCLNFSKSIIKEISNIHEKEFSTDSKLSLDSFYLVIKFSILFLILIEKNVYIKK